jgi:hypothetical protein
MFSNSNCWCTCKTAVRRMVLKGRNNLLNTGQILAICGSAFRSRIILKRVQTSEMGLWLKSFRNSARNKTDRSDEGRCLMWKKGHLLF